MTPASHGLRRFTLRITAVIFFVYLVSAHLAFAANPTDLSIIPEPLLTPSQFDLVGNWQPYCSSGQTNYLRWYTGDNVLEGFNPNFDCAKGDFNSTSYPLGVPGAIALWNFVPSVLPVTLPHNPAIQTGAPDGDFYLTLTSASSTYSFAATNPAGITLIPDPVGSAEFSALDLVGNFRPYCTSGQTNYLRWYTGDDVLHSANPGFDCALGMNNSANSAGVPGAIYLWNYGSSIGSPGNYYFTLTNASGTVTRFDWSWNTAHQTTRFDWGWHDGAYTFPATTTQPQYCTAGSTPDCNSNVMFLPGIEGSRLYDSENGGTKLWESSDNLAQGLAMSSSGTSLRSDVYTKDIIDTIPIDVFFFSNVYKNFIDKMDSVKASGKINDWKAVPYDWRLSLDQILSSGLQVTPDAGVSYLTATSSPYIIQTLKSLAATSKTGKVTIIAHSNGGLLTKKLIQTLGADASKYVDKIIFVAVPSLGTPQAVEGILSGQDEAVPSHVNAATARYLGQNWSMPYNLLPSTQYFTNVDEPAITFDPATMQDWITKYGTSVVHSTDRLAAFLLDTTHSQIPTPNDTDLVTPVHVNQTLFNAATSLHIGIDNWTPPDGIQLFEIAGVGNETLSGITYKRVADQECVKYDFFGKCSSYKQLPDKLSFDPNHTIHGDGTVVEPSALWASGASVQRYWVNLANFNLDHDKVSTSTTITAQLHQLLFTDHGRIFKVDELNTLLTNILASGINAQLPVKYITTVAPSSLSDDRLHFTLHSPLTLGFTDSSGMYTGLTATTTNFGIPGVSYERYGDVQWLSLPKSLAGQLQMHGTGSGSFTLDIDEVSGGETTKTTTFMGVPSSTSTAATINISPNSSPTATDVLNVDFNGDGAVDRVLTAKQGTIVLPDITPPEVVVSVSTSTRDISVTGLDNVSSSTAVTKTATTTAVTDASGNKTTLFFQKTFTGNIITYARLTGINYGTSTIPLPSSFLYIWDSTKTLISQTVIVDNNFGIEAPYDKVKNKTTILVKKKGAQIQTTVLSGLRLVKLTTNKGGVSYSW